MGSKQAAFGAFAVICMVMSAIFVPSVGHAQDPKAKNGNGDAEIESGEIGHSEN